MTAHQVAKIIELSGTKKNANFKVEKAIESPRSQKNIPITKFNQFLSILRVSSMRNNPSKMEELDSPQLSFTKTVNSNAANSPDTNLQNHSRKSDFSYDYFEDLYKMAKEKSTYHIKCLGFDVQLSLLQSLMSVLMIRFVEFKILISKYQIVDYLWNALFYSGSIHLIFYSSFLIMLIVTLSGIFLIVTAWSIYSKNFLYKHEISLTGYNHILSNAQYQREYAHQIIKMAKKSMEEIHGRKNKNNLKNGSVKAQIMYTPFSETAHVFLEDFKNEPIEFTRLKITKSALKISYYGSFGVSTLYSIKLLISKTKSYSAEFASDVSDESLNFQNLHTPDLHKLLKENKGIVSYSKNSKDDKLRLDVNQFIPNNNQFTDTKPKNENDNKEIKDNEASQDEVFSETHSIKETHENTLKIEEIPSQLSDQVSSQNQIKNVQLFSTKTQQMDENDLQIELINRLMDKKLKLYQSYISDKEAFFLERDEDALKVYGRDDPEFITKICKIRFEASPEEIIEAINDPEVMQDANPLLKSFKILKQYSDRHMLQYQQLSIPFPFQNRDFCHFVKIFKLSANHLVQIASSCDPLFNSLSDGITRGDTEYIVWDIVGRGDSLSEVTITSRINMNFSLFSKYNNKKSS
jgi:hypothetical protein